MNNFKHTAHKNNYQLDLLGRPINVGDRILTKSYGSPCMDTFATVKTVNKKSITVDTEYRTWSRNLDTNQWESKITIKPMKRVGYHSCLVVNELEAISTMYANEFINNHPEMAI